MEFDPILLTLPLQFMLLFVLEMAAVLTLLIFKSSGNNELTCLKWFDLLLDGLESNMKFNDTGKTDSERLLLLLALFVTGLDLNSEKDSSFCPHASKRGDRL